MRRHLRPDRLKGDRGAVLVEAVFVFPVVFFIVMAILEYGLLFAAQSTTQSSTREGARFAAANFAVAADKKVASDQVMAVVAKDLGALTSYDTPIQLLVYKSDNNGDPVGGSLTSCTASCFHYTWNGTAFVNDTGSPAVEQPTGVHQLHARQPRDLCRGQAQLHHRRVRSSQLLKEHTVSRLEPLPLIQCP